MPTETIMRGGSDLTWPKVKTWLRQHAIGVSLSSCGVGLVLVLILIAPLGRSRHRDAPRVVAQDHLPVTLPDQKKPPEPVNPTEQKEPADPVKPTAEKKAADKEGSTVDDKKEKVKKLLHQAAKAALANDAVESIVIADEVLELDPTNVEALYIRGTTNMMLANSTSPPDMLRWAKANYDLRRAAQGKTEYKKTYETSERQYKKLAILMGID